MLTVELGSPSRGRNGSVIQVYGDHDVNPEVLQRQPKEDAEFGIFGQDAIIWNLSRSKEIGLCKGKPRQAARLIVVKDLFDKSDRELLLKRLPYMSETKLKRFWMEIETHRHVCLLGGWDYICRFYGVRNCPTRRSADGRPIVGKLDYVMEMGSEGDILGYIQNQWKKFQSLTTREDQKVFLGNHVANTRRIIAQIGCAVKQCFDAKIVHFDLKLENVVMTKILEQDRERYKSKMNVNGREFDWCVKLIDFGLARHFVGNNWTYREGRKGTPRYMAPEIAAGSRNIQNARIADIWPVGIMLWECLAGLPLWKEAKPEVKIYNEMLKAGSFKKWFDQLCKMDQNRHFPQFVPSEAADLLDGIFRQNPAERSTIEEILAHDFLKSQVPTMFGVHRSQTDVTAFDRVDSNQELKLMPTVSNAKKIGAIKNINMEQSDYPASEDVEDKENDAELNEQRAGEDIPDSIRRRQSIAVKCEAIRRWFCTWGLYSFFVLGYIVACPLILNHSGFWELHAYWSVFVGVLPLIFCLFTYHMARGLLESSDYVSVSVGSHFRSTVWSTIWFVGFKPFVTILSQLSTLAIALMWFHNESWTNIEDKGDEPDSGFATKENGYFILGVFITHQVLSALFFFLRDREMKKISSEEDSGSLKIFLAQLCGLALFWEVENACRIRRQTGLIREHKIVEGILNSFITLVIVIYYYFRYSIGVGSDGDVTHPPDEVTKELTWLVFSAFLSLLSVSLVLNMSDFVGISVEKSVSKQFCVDVFLIIFRMAEVSLRVGAIAVFAACIGWIPTVCICIGGFIILFLLSYLDIFSVTKHRFEFEKNGVIQQTVNTAFSAMYGTIAMPLLDQWVYGLVGIVFDCLLIGVAFLLNEESTLWDEPQSFWILYIGIPMLFLIGAITYFVFDWEQYNEIMSVKADSQQVAEIIELCMNKPALLNRFLVAGVLRVATVRAFAVQDWDEYGKTRDWLKTHGFYDLLEYKSSKRSNTMSHVTDVSRNSVTRKKTLERPEVVESGPKDVYFEPDEEPTKLIHLNKWHESHEFRAKCLCMAVSPDGKHLAVGLEDSPYLEVLELPSLKLIMDLKSSQEYVGAVTGVEFRRSVTGALQLITVAEDARMRIYEPLSSSRRTNVKTIGSFNSKLIKTTNKIRCLAMDYSRKICAVGVCNDIWVVNLETGDEDTIKGHEGEVTAIKFFPDQGRQFVTCSNDMTVRIWDSQGSEPYAISTILDWGKWKENNGQDIVRTLDINANGTSIACGCINGYVIIWQQIESKSWGVSSRIRMWGWVDKIDFLPEEYGSLLIAHTRPTRTVGMAEEKEWEANGYSAVWDYKAGKCNFALVQPHNAIRSSCILQKKEGLKLITGSWSARDQHFVVLWDLDKHING